jgi:hypothetical protein
MPSIVGWFCRLPSPAYAAGSVVPPICYLALVAARAPLAALREDAQNDSTLATTPDGPEVVRTAGLSPTCDELVPLFHVG